MPPCLPLRGPGRRDNDWYPIELAIDAVQGLLPTFLADALKQHAPRLLEALHCSARSHVTRRRAIATDLSHHPLFLAEAQKATINRLVAMIGEACPTTADHRIPRRLEEGRGTEAQQAHDEAVLRQNLVLCRAGSDA